MGSITEQRSKVKFLKCMLVFVEQVGVSVCLEQVEYVCWLMALSQTQKGVCVEADQKGLALQDEGCSPQGLLNCTRKKVGSFSDTWLPRCDLGNWEQLYELVMVGNMDCCIFKIRDLNEITFSSVHKYSVVLLSAGIFSSLTMHWCCICTARN